MSAKPAAAAAGATAVLSAGSVAGTAAGSAANTGGGNTSKQAAGSQGSTSSAGPVFPPELGYLELPKRIDDDGPSWRTHEGFREKFTRKTKENPFVPLGLCLTIGALSYGLWQMRTGNRVMSQKMMRLRVAAQAFTVVALMTGVYYQSVKNKPAD